MKTPSVDQFLDTLGHPQRALIDQTRQLVHDAAPGLVEGLKWNAPSFSLGGNDIVTFNFRNFGAVALVFHTGPKGKDTHTGTRILAAAPGWVQWIADKRFVVAVADPGFLKDHGDDLAGLVRTWVHLAKDWGAGVK